MPDPETMYWQLSPDARAEIDAKWGPPPPRQANTEADARESQPRDLSADAPADLPADAFEIEKRRGTGRVFPTKFFPPSASITPIELFPGQTTYANLSR
jgi:hypothetical protein